MSTAIPSFPHDEVDKLIRAKREKHKKQGEKMKVEKSVKLDGHTFKCDPHVNILVGPVVGKVTTTTAIVLLEVSATAKVSVVLVNDADKHDVKKITHVLNTKLPITFYFEGLTPNTKYHIYVEGVNAKALRACRGSFKTFEENPKQIRVAIVSCDRPERHLPGEKLMWKVLSDRINKGEVDLMVHVGDQVYAQKEAVDAAAIYNHSDIGDSLEDKEREYRLLQTYENARNRLADVYRFTWSLPYTARCLANVPHYMIWSDNDIYNDFTIAEGVPPVLIKLGQQTYRLYQRALWDENIHDDSDHTEEQHFHKFGALGLMILDMRGNRVNPEGQQFPDKPIVSDNQWKQIEELCADDSVKALIVCAEIPFVSESPEKVKAGAEKFPFLKDHWGYCPDELFRLLDLLFNWKKAGNGTREVVLVGGDIHVGVNSVVKDSQTGLEIKQITTSPITNHVCEYYPAREGSLNDRYSYTHVSLDHQKNYGYFIVNVSDDGQSATIDSHLIGDKDS